MVASSESLDLRIELGVTTEIQKVKWDMKGGNRALKKRLTAHKCDCGENIENREGNFNSEKEG